MYTDLQKIIHVLGGNREEAQSGLVAIDQKLKAPINASISESTNHSHNQRMNQPTNRPMEDSIGECDSE